MSEEKYKYEIGCFKNAIEEGTEEEPDFTSWCGNGDCGIVNYLLSIIKEREQK